MKQFLRKLPGIRHLLSISTNSDTIASVQKPSMEILLDNYLRKNLYEHARYQKPGMLNLSEKKCFSQSGEDGLIAEIFSRIGKTNKYFVEFGVQDGLECNTTCLLFDDWQGVWFEGDPVEYAKIRSNLEVFIRPKKLSISNLYITPENFEDALLDANVPEEPDMLSIDIDFNDYWIWKSLQNFRPRVVIIEYNAFFPPPIKFVVDYNPNAKHDGSTYFGASLKSIELLGKQKGYRLVGCSFSGVNAFFVREDLACGKFAEPAIAEVFYEPLRGFLTFKIGLKRKIGPFKSV